MKRPVLPVALYFCAGILLGEFFPWKVPLPVVFGAAFVVFLVALLVGAFRVWMLGPLILLAGWTNFSVHTEILSPIDLRIVAGDKTQLATVIGRLEETPREKLYLHGTRESWRSHAVVAVEAIKLGDERVPACGRVVAACPHALDQGFFRGRKVEISGVLRPPSGPLADGLFDYRSYLKWQGIHHQLRTTSTNDWKLAADPEGPHAPPWVEQFFQRARTSIATGLPTEDEPLHLLWAMTLDWRADFTEDLEEPFIRAGTYHIFAVDGLRIGIISMVIVVVLRALRVSRPLCGFLLIPLVWIYVAGTGWPASAIRSAIMCTVVALGWVANRPGDTLNSLFASAFIILAWDPLQLFQAGFQLSFVVVICILVVMPVFEAWRIRILEIDPFLPEELLTRGHRWRRAILGYVSEWFFISLAAWLGSIPLTAYYFHLISPASLPANLVAVPLSVLALAGNIASVVCADWLPWVAGLFNQASWFLMKAIWLISAWSANFAGGFWYVPAPGVGAMVLYYAVLLALFSGWLIEPKHRKWRIVGMAAALGWSVIGWLGSNCPSRLDILGESAGILYQPSDRRGTLLMNCGNESVANSLTKPFLRAQGINRLPGLLTTHGDVRHAGGASIIVTNFIVEKILGSPGATRSPVYRKFRDGIAGNDGRWQPVQRGDSVGTWSVLHPDTKDHFSQGSDFAIVLRGRIAGASVLLLSDLGKAGQRMLVEREKDIQADVVVAELPNQGEPLEGELLNAIRPKLIVIQDSEYPAKSKARETLRARLAAKNVPVFYVSDQGSLTLEFAKTGWRMRNASGGTLFTSD